MTMEEAITIMQLYKDELEHRIANIDYDIREIDLYSIHLDAFEVAIEALSAEDEQGGTWRDGFGFAHCSICGKGVPRAIGEQTPFNFCPYCGARMRNEK